MNYKIISKTLGKYLLYFSLILWIPLIIALYYEFIAIDTSYPNIPSSFQFFETFIFSLLISLILMFLGKNAKGSLMRRESILLVVLIWIFTAFVAGLPFYLTGTLEKPLDAYFESMSGLTTTGATVMCAKKYDGAGNEIPIHVTNEHVPEKTYTFYGTIPPVKDPKTGLVKYEGIEAVSRGILFWRSFIQWLGGMGIVVLFLAVLPALTAGGKYLYQMEVPGPTKDTLAPRIKETASILWKIYLAFTVVQIYLLIWTNPSMPLFDAFCITFSTLSTGGFTIKNMSIGAYNNIHTEWVVIIFMLVGGCNFAIFFHIIKRKLYRLYEPDFLFYILFTLIGGAIISITIFGHKQVLLNGVESTYSLAQAIREGMFQAISAQTSTGFATTDYDKWPFPPQLLLLMLMYVGGMAGSTAGGIKTSRIYILMKIVVHKIRSIFHPEMVKKLKIGRQEINTKTSSTVLSFFAIVMFFVILGTILLTFNGVDPETSVSVITCMLNNIGMSFRAAGPTESFAFLSPFAKILSCLWMMLGRLEYFAILLLLMPSFWKKN